MSKIKLLACNLHHVNIQGTLIGYMWWPTSKGYLNFSKKLEVDHNNKEKRFVFPDEWVDLDKALQDITNCGEFQGCKISYETLSISLVYRQDGLTIEKPAQIPQTAKIFDGFITDDYPEYQEEY